MSQSPKNQSQPWDDDEHSTYRFADDQPRETGVPRAESSAGAGPASHDEQPSYGSEAQHESPVYDLGWGDSAWAEAGGFDAVLVGHLLGDHGGGGYPSVVVIPIEHLEINNTNLFETTQIFLNASNGGSIQVGGSVDAESNQGLLGGPAGVQGFSGGPAAHGGHDTGGHDTTATNNVALFAGNGDGNFIGGNVVAVADQVLYQEHAF